MKRIFNQTRKSIALLTGLVIFSIVLAFWVLPSRLPAARYGAVMIYDPVGKRAFLFGGRSEGLFGMRYFNDLWVFDPLTQDWMPITPARRPPGRLSPAMVYDPVRQQIILFGGYDGHERLADTWTYKISENQWEEITPAISPPARSDTGMLYDNENGVLILFGGMCQEDQRVLCNDTWIFSPDTNTWVEMQPLSPPMISYGHALVIDPVHQQAVLWGGHQTMVKNGQATEGGYRDSLWRYDYVKNIWQEWVHTYKPPARYWQMAVCDTHNNQLVLFGGNGFHSYYNDTWFYHLDGDTWERVSPDHAPSPRVNAAMTYDPANQIIILFGGLDEDDKTLQDTWIFEVKDNVSEWSLVEAR